MKKLYKITPYVMLGLMVAGCTDLDTEPLSSTITSDQKEEVVESDPSRLEASVAATHRLGAYITNLVLREIMRRSEL